MDSKTKEQFLKEKYNNFLCWAESNCPEFIKSDLLCYKNTSFETFVMFFHNFCKEIIKKTGIAGLLALMFEKAKIPVKEVKEADIKKLAMYIEMFDNMIE